MIRPSLIHERAVNDSDPALFSPLEAQTSLQGAFEVHLPTDLPISLDLEVYDQTGLDEFIDIAKLDKACYVRFSTEESDVENRLRANQSDGPEVPLVPTVPVQVESQGIRPRLETNFQAREYPSHWSGEVGSLTDGLLTVDDVSSKVPATVYNVNELPVPGQGTQIGAPEKSQIAVANNGMWWWKNAVHIRANHEEGSSWWFTDETNDTYYLDIVGTIVLPYAQFPLPYSWHRVSYNSKNPNIVKIEYTN